MTSELSQKNISEFSDTELLNLFQCAKTEIIQVEAISEKIESYERDIRIWQNQPVEGLTFGMRVGWWFFYYLISASACGLAAALLGGLFNSASFISTVMMVTVFPCMLIVAPYLTFKKHKNRIRDAENLYSSNIIALKNDLSKIGETLDCTIDRVCKTIWLVPEGYRYSLALETMTSYLTSQRAMCWRDCVNYYSEQEHRWTLERNSTEALRMQNQLLMVSESTAESARAAALFAGITAISSISNRR